MGNIQSCRKYRPRNGNNYGDIELQSMTNPISIYPMEGEAVASMQGQEVEPMEGEAVVSIQKGAVEQTQEDQQQGQAAQASSSQPIWLPDAGMKHSFITVNFHHAIRLKLRAEGELLSLKAAPISVREWILIMWCFFY